MRCQGLLEVGSLWVAIKQFPETFKYNRFGIVSQETAEANWSQRGSYHLIAWNRTAKAGRFSPSMGTGNL